ncbi:DUF2924 domain-containing protein [Thalassoglobus sp. JC818]|uniref:DUF2924 domain-containing protein n=1 Tax=Thalassoglobus sp. JC818 TaxID=3232136 RepID=UPI003457DDBF
MNIENELAALQQLTTDELRNRYAEVFGEPPRSRHKAYLIRKVGWRLQAIAEGDLSQRARRRAEELAVEAEVRTTPPRDDQPMISATKSVKSALQSDPRLPSPGTSITKKYKGQTLEVRVLQSGFEYDGERFKTLSAVAKAITGSHCNGFRFFKLGGAT